MTVIRASVSPGEFQLAVCDARDDLLEFAIWRPHCPDGVGDIYAGKVHRIVPALGGAFVALGEGFGFLPLGRDGKGLSEGDLVCVRVSRAAQAGKGPRLALCAGEDARPASIGLIRRGAGILHELAARFPDAAIVIDDARAMARLRGEFGERMRLEKAAFSQDLAARVAELYEPSITLAGGGRAQFSITPALCAIDVDLGSGSDAMVAKDRAHLEANRAAVAAIVRQIGLRNLGGVIMIDFAGLKPRARASLAPDVQAALVMDALVPRLLGFTQAGLAEILRPRVRPALAEQAGSAQGQALAALREAAAILRRDAQARIELRLRPEQAASLRAMPAAIEELSYGAVYAPVIVELAGARADYADYEVMELPR